MTRNDITKGSRVRINGEKVEYGTVNSIDPATAGSFRLVDVRFDDGTFCSVPFVKVWPA